MSRSCKCDGDGRASNSLEHCQVVLIWFFLMAIFSDLYKMRTAGVWFDWLSLSGIVAGFKTRCIRFFVEFAWQCGQGNVSLTASRPLCKASSRNDHFARAVGTGEDLAPDGVLIRAEC